jgi:hypothetical protein
MIEIGGHVGFNKKNMCYAKLKLQIHVMQLRSMTCLQIHMRAHFERFGVEVMPMQKPMAHSLTFTLGSSI